MNGYFLFWYPFCSSLFMQVGMSGSPLNSQKLLFLFVRRLRQINVRFMLLRFNFCDFLRGG